MFRTYFPDFTTKAKFLTLLSFKVVFGTAVSAVEPASFTILDDIIGYETFYIFAHAISADGRTIVGATSPDDLSIGKAFYWTAQTGMQNLGTLSGATSYSSADDVSEDGSVIVGISFHENSAHYEAFYWTVEDGMQGLGFLDGHVNSGATGVSADGSVVVGFSDDGVIELDVQAFRWTTEDGMIGLGYLDTDVNYSVASGVSGDGTIIVGLSDVLSDDVLRSRAFRWTETTGMQELGNVDGDSHALAISDDGSTIVGYFVSSTNIHAGEAFRWTEATGMVGLGYLNSPGSDSTTAAAVSGDGSIVVGFSSNNETGQTTATRWSQEAGLQDLRGLLIGAGLNMEGTYLTRATSISADGTIIVGTLVPSEDIIDPWDGYIAVYSQDSVGLGNFSNLSASAFATSHASKSAMTSGMLLGGGVMNVASNYRLSFPSSSQDVTRSTKGSTGWSYAAFATGTASWGQQDYSGLDQANDGVIGLMAQSPGGLRLGLGLATSSMDGDTSTINSNFDASGTGIVAFAAYEPTTSPWRFYGAATWLSLDADITRNYLNGAATETATGQTDGTFWSVEARVAYELPMRANTHLRPYLSLLAGEADYDGYTEVGGVFSGTVSAQNTSFRKAAVGIESATAVSDRLSVTAEAELGHVRESGTNSALSVISLGGMSFGGGSGDRSYNVGTVGLGLTYQASARTSLHANARYYGALENLAQSTDTLSLQLGLVTRF